MYRKDEAAMVTGPRIEDIHATHPWKPLFSSEPSVFVHNQCQTLALTLAHVLQLTSVIIAYIMRQGREVSGSYQSS